MTAKHIFPKNPDLKSIFQTFSYMYILDFIIMNEGKLCLIF